MHSQNIIFMARKRAKSWAKSVYVQVYQALFAALVQTLKGESGENVENVVKPMENDGFQVPLRGTGNENPYETNGIL